MGTSLAGMLAPRLELRGLHEVCLSGGELVSLREDATPSDSGVITLDPTAHERQAVAATLERLRKGTPMADPAKPTEAVSAGALDRSCFLKVKAS